MRNSLMVTVAFLAAAVAIVRIAGAQQPKSKAPTNRPASQPAAAPVNSTGAAQRAEILNSPRWKQAIFAMTEWLSAQPYYKRDQVDAMTASFSTRATKMSPNELAFTLQDMETKLQILASPPAQEAMAWQAREFSTMADKRLQETLKTLPNLTTMTAAQLSQQILEIQQKRAAIPQQQAMVQPQGNPWAQANSAAQQAYLRDRRPTPGNYSSPYRTPPPRDRSKDVPEGPRISYTVGTYGGFGMTYSPNRW